MTIIPLTDEIKNSVKKYHNSPMTKIKRMRLKRSLTQAELARLAGLNIGTIGHYDQGTRKITPEHRKAIAKVLHCNLTDI